MAWLKIFDASGSWPTDPAACWADGYRAIAGYAGSQSWKTFTPAMLAKWVTPAHPFGIAAMYESSGYEPFAANSYTVGKVHASTARTAWRAYGMPDSAAIAYAVDRNATMAEIRGPIAAYFRGVAAADTCKPIAYLENDGADWLAAQGIIAGGFIPAAYSWNNPAVLVTPANASVHTLWTQEHNGVSLHGGDVDIGHIRDDAPIWWADKTGGTDMAGFDKTDLHTLLTTAAFPYAAPSVSLGTTWDDTHTNTEQALTKLDALAASQAGQDLALKAMAATLTTVMQAGGTDAAPLLAKLDEMAAAETQAFADLLAENRSLLARLAAAEKASADALAATP